jgi:hypothetical protein
MHALVLVIDIGPQLNGMPAAPASQSNLLNSLLN